MSTPDPTNEDAVLKDLERIGRMAMGDINIEEYEALLFRVGAMLAVYRSAMDQAKFSANFIESTCWMIMTSMFGHHLTTTEITFVPQDTSTEGPQRGTPRTADTTEADPGAST